MSEKGESPGPSRPYSLADDASVKSRSKQDEAEREIEESFAPPKDEESAFQQYEAHPAKDPNLVEWDEEDVENPMNMSKARKWRISIITALMTFVVSFGSSVFSTATNVTAEEFGVSSEVM
ncbi:hypothetical protein LTR17_027487 [Elasticomyces elasticus]|nr:hypothetical protein LTR17_027487 [Elasticomyces elasticus]